MRLSSHVRTVEQLADALGEGFVILFGSAVAGKLTPRVPMVTEVETNILILAAQKLQLGSRSDRLIAEYARELARDKGHYKSLLARTKFETFLYKLGRAVGKAGLEDLLIRLYVCSNEEYGPNQSAISFLMAKRICLACLTTNFDNALEISYPNLKVFDQSYKPVRLPEKLDAPILLKLHGDAASRSCVATSPQLSTAKQRNHYAYLVNLLRGRKLLILGYSGTGDIDIAPQLDKVDAPLFWCGHSLESIPKPTKVLCDLSLTTGESKNGLHNLLLELAERFGWSNSQMGRDHSWMEELRNWVDDVNITDLSQFVRSLLDWQTSWPNLHIAYYRCKEAGSKSRQLELVDAMAQVAAYQSAENSLRALLQTGAVDFEAFAEAQTLLGFTLWRAGKFMEALKTLGAIAKREYWERIPDLDVLHHLQDAARHYLETLSEMMQYRTRLADRVRLCQEMGAREVIDSLIRLPKPSTEDEYLARVVILEIDHRIGTHVEVAEVRELFDECYAMEDWAAASVAVRLLLSISLSEGFAAMQKLNEKLFERRDWKQIQKNWASFIHECLHGRYPVVLMILNGRLLMPFKTRVIELDYLIRRWVWNRDWDVERFRTE